MSWLEKQVADLVKRLAVYHTDDAKVCAAFQAGLAAAADYVDGNYDTAHMMAHHLHEVAAGRRPLYQE